MIDPKVKPLAIVIPWFGVDLKGGAEQQAFQIATRLAARGHGVEVLTTCNRSFHDDWSLNHHPPGVSSDHGLTLRRFPVARRDPAAFDRVNAKLLARTAGDLRPGVSPLSADEAGVFVSENINSDELLAHLRERGADYHAFIFMPYMFGPIVQGLPSVADGAFLQPCLHDESAAYLSPVAEIFRAARGLLFNSEGERRLALKLYGPGIFPRSFVIGEGIEPVALTPAEINAARPPALSGAPFVLSLGRRDATKNTDLLIRAYRRFKINSPQSDLRLVLAGPGDGRSFDAPEEGINDFGLVNESTKAWLLQHARALFQPSRHESFSRVIMEAWGAGRPVAAHRECLATRLAVEASGGGWLAATEAEWAKLFSRLAVTDEKRLDELGRRGRAYAAEHANWERVIERYERILNLRPEHHALSETAEGRRQTADGSDANNSSDITVDFPSSLIPHPSSLPLSAVHQLLPDFVYGDAIAQQCVALRGQLRAAGYESEILALRVERRVAGQAQFFDASRIKREDGLLYHHSIGSDVTAFAARHPGPKCLIYHNVTPAEFFAPYRPGFAWMLETGRAQLPRLASCFPVSVGDSAFNAEELRTCGFHSPGVLPIIIDPAKWNFAPDAALMDQLQDGQTNLLFVGRIAPNKRQDQLVEAFARYRKLDPRARLILAGDGQDFDPYFQRVREQVARHDLRQQVHVTGQLDDAALLAYYRTAHLYWSFSEHEGFGAPLVEAMWFDVPVLAFGGTAVSETLGDAGALFDAEHDLERIAELAFALAHDTTNGRRAGALAAQAARRLRFLPANVADALQQIIIRMETTAHR